MFAFARMRFGKEGTMETEQGKKKAPTILIVDDISVNVTILDNILSHEGYATMTALSVQEALELMKQGLPDLILSDLSMPEIDGMAFCRMLKSDQATRDIPFIFITVLNTSKEKEEAFTAGAVDFIPKPFDNVEVLMRVNNHLKSYRMQQEMTNYNRMMHRLVEDQKKQIESVHGSVLRALSKIIRRKDPGTGSHGDRVGYNCKLLAQGLQFSPAYEDVVTDEFVEAISIAARLHDIGRFAVADEDKNADRKDPAYIRRCAEEGGGIIREFGAEQEGGAMEMTRQIVECHHAHWDGSGFPEAKGKKIPLEARIVAVANDFDEMIAPWDGSAPRTVEESVAYIDEQSGLLYDPDVVRVFDKLCGRMKTN